MDIILYSDNSGKQRIEVYYENETFWMNQKQIAELFGVGVSAINKHIKNIYADGELLESTTVSKKEIVVNRGFRGNVPDLIDFFNLDMIIAVGYRVNSMEATRFRIWATNTLKEFIIKGFVIDDERLKQGSRFGKDYFEELLERIREIRASERRFYLKITDIYEQCSIDYDKNSELTNNFFKTVQNKLHWAVTGKTAAEIIHSRADANKPYMNLQTWKNAPTGKILKSDVKIAKNYLFKDEIKELERIVSMYLDYAENQAHKRKPMKMKDWIDKLDAFLKFNEYEILNCAGSISHEVAIKLAENEFEKFRIIQDKSFTSDFEKEIKKISGKGKSNEQR